MGENEEVESGGEVKNDGENGGSGWFHILFSYVRTLTNV
jgi:hypothetical protein